MFLLLGGFEEGINDIAQDMQGFVDVTALS